MTQEQKAFNWAMSKERIAVEWGFGNVVWQFAFIDFKKNLKTLLSPVGLCYQCAIIFTNIHTCYYYSQTSQHFQVDPPHVQDYLQPDLYDEILF